MIHRSALVLTAILVGWFPAASAHGQTLHGLVRDSVTRVPVSGAFVSAYDSAGSRVAGILTDSAGRFFFSSARVRTLRVSRIGYAPSELRPDTSAVRVLLQPEPVDVAPLTAAATAECALPRVGSQSSIAAVWTRIRDQLDLVRWSTMENQLEFVITTHRVARTKGRLTQLAKETTDTVRRLQPFVSDSLQRIVREGFVQRKPGGSIVYWAPSIEILMSRWFEESHCFSIVGGARRVGLRFRPKSLEKPVLTGIIWLRTGTGSELGSMEFEFAGGDVGKMLPVAEGSVRFARMATGHAIVSDWKLQATSTFREYDVREPRIVVEEAGGKVVKVFRWASDRASRIARD